MHAHSPAKLSNSCPRLLNRRAPRATAVRFDGPRSYRDLEATQQPDANGLRFGAAAPCRVSSRFVLFDNTGKPAAIIAT